ncbi:4346_t:CDS:2, partial [Cetraspora pellucida]
MSNLGNTSDLNNVLDSSDDTFSSTLKDISKHAFKEESIRSTEKVPSAKSENYVVLSSIMVGQYYDTKSDILNAAQENAKNLGFAVTIKSSSSHHINLQCKRGGKPRNNWNLTVDTRKRKKMSKRCECPYFLKAIPDNSKWRVVEIVNEHNHAMAKDIRVFHEHRQLIRDTRHTAVKMLKAGAKPSMVYEAVRDEDGTPTVTRKDISNLSARIHSLEETASMGVLIMGMKDRGYTHFNDDSFDEIIKMVDSFIHSRDREALDAAITAYNKLASLSLNENEVLKYLGRMMKVREKWVGIYTSRIMHFGATTTQRVESTHSAIKHALETSGSLMRAFNYLDRWLRLHHEENSLQNESESVGIDPLLVYNDKERLALLLGKVAQFALDRIKNELLKATTYEACLCELRVNYNIPCRHLLPAKDSVMLSIIPTRWLLFPDEDRLYANYQVQNLTNLQVSDSDNYFLLKSQLYEIENRYMSFPDEQQRSTLLEKLNEILTVPVINLSEIGVPEKIIGKGRPSGTKQLPIAIELMEQAEKKKKVKTIEKKQNDSVNLPQNISSRGNRLRFQLSSRIPIDDINEVYDPKSDGNCGFRSLAVAIRGNEENWILVKLAMSGQLTKRMEIYKNWLGYDTDLLNQILRCRASPCSPSLWFLSPDCAQLAADTFSVPIAIFNEQNGQ